MTNKEKYKELITSGDCDCDFVIKHILKYRRYDCDRLSCNACRMMQFLWLDEEAEEEDKAVDWSKVEVDTPIFVSSDGKTWFKRYFAKFEDGIIWAWANGATSWSTDIHTPVQHWKYNYAKIADRVIKVGDLMKK